MSLVFTRAFEDCVLSLIVDSIDICNTKQRAVLEAERGKGVIRCIPQKAAGDLHPLPMDLTHVDQDSSFISGGLKVLHTFFYYLGKIREELS